MIILHFAGGRRQPLAACAQRGAPLLRQGHRRAPGAHHRGAGESARPQRGHGRHDGRVLQEDVRAPRLQRPARAQVRGVPGLHPPTGPGAHHRQGHAQIHLVAYKHVTRAHRRETVSGYTTQITSQNRCL
jgi:hypothetical protein